MQAACESLRCSLQSSCVATEPPFGSAKYLTRTDRPSGSSVMRPSGPLGVFVEILDADVEHAALEPQLQQFAARSCPGEYPSASGRRSRDSDRCRTRSAPARSVITTPWLRLFRAELTNAFRRSCERLTLRRAEWIQSAIGRQKRTDDDAADQHFPDHVGVGRADIARRRKVVGQAPGGPQRRNGGDQAHDGLRRNQVLAACLPILASHRPPADFERGVSGFTGLDRVNAYPCNRKCDLNYGNCPDMINASLTGARLESVPRRIQRVVGRAFRPI